jgi:hypothetical protein
LGITNKIVVQSTVQATVQTTNTDPGVKPDPPAAGCNETVYDGVDDSYTSFDSNLLLSGAFTVAMEVYRPSNISQYTWITTLSNAGVDYPFGIFWNVTNDYFRIQKNSGSEGYVSSLAPTAAVWGRLVFGIQTNNQAFFYYYNGTSWAGSENLLTTTAMAAHDRFILGGPPPGSTQNTINATLRNVQIYDGEASNKNGWDTTTSSLLGVTLKAEAADGSFENVSPSATYVKAGDPVIQECT